MCLCALCVILPALVSQFPKQLESFSRGFWVGIFAPTGEQVKKMYNEVLSAAKSSQAFEIYGDPEINTVIETYGAKWSNGSFVFSQSASPRTATESKTFHLIVYEESQGLLEKVITDKLEPMLAYHNGSGIMIGTPSDEPCYFHTVIQQNKISDVGKDEKIKTHFEFDYKTVMEHNPKYKKHVQKQIERHGETNPSFLKSYGLKWLFENSRAISAEDIKNYAMYHSCSIKKYSQNPTVAGIDIARKRNSSVVTVGEVVKITVFDEEKQESEVVTGIRICNWLELNQMTYPEMRAEIRDFLSNYPGLQKVVVDSTGVGDPMLQEMQNEWDIADILDGFIFSAKSKSYLKDVFYEMLHKRKIIIPSTDSARENILWQRFYTQLIELEKRTSGGYTYLTKSYKESSRDDFPDSLFLALHAAYTLIEHSGIEFSNWKDAYSYEKKSFGLTEVRKKVHNGEFYMESGRAAKNNKLLRGLMG